MFERLLLDVMMMEIKVKRCVLTCHHPSGLDNSSNNIIRDFSAGVFNVRQASFLFFCFLFFVHGMHILKESCSSGHSLLGTAEHIHWCR